MAIELNYNDIESAGEAAEATAAAGSGDGNAISGLNSTLQEVNSLMDNFMQMQSKAAQMQGQQGQQASQGNPGGMANPTSQPSPNQGGSGQKPQQSSEKTQSMIEQINPAQVYGFITDAVVKIEEDIGEDATMQDLEEYLVENREDIQQLIGQGQQMIASGQAQKFIGDNSGN